MLDGYQYGYNLEGNVTYRQNLALDVTHGHVPANPVALDQIYGYDDLGELISLAQAS